MKKEEDRECGEGGGNRCESMVGGRRYTNDMSGGSWGRNTTYWCPGTIVKPLGNVEGGVGIRCL